jgi:hypothetical protein
VSTRLELPEWPVAQSDVEDVEGDGLRFGEFQMRMAKMPTIRRSRLRASHEASGSRRRTSFGHR